MSSRPSDFAAGLTRTRSFLHSPWVAPLLGLLCFASSLGNGFVYDDTPLVLDNPRIRALGSGRAIWLSDWWQPVADDLTAPAQRDRLYRPLPLFTFALNYAVHGYRPLGYHLVNVLLHGAAGLLVWKFARRLTGDLALASVAAALFAVHPVHAEAVANVVGRAELLATVFLLAGLLALLPQAGPAKLRHALLAAPLFFLALLSKESAISFPVVALLVLWKTSAGRRTWRSWAAHAVLLALPLAVYFPLRFVALEQHLFRPEPSVVWLNPLVMATPAQRVLGAFTVLGHYTRLMLAPAKLSADYGLAIVDPRAGLTPVTLLGFLSAGGIVAGLLVLRRRTEVARLVATLTAMLVASYALISNTVLLIGVALAERLFYWPSVSVVMLAGLGAVQLWRTRCAAGRPWEKQAVLLRWLGALLVMALGLRCVVRGFDWHDNLTLVTQDLATYPQSAHFNRGYAHELMKLTPAAQDPDARRQLFETAEKYLARALDVDPAMADALALRARVRLQLGDPNAARRYASSALLLNPRHGDALAVLSAVGGVPPPDLARLAADVATRPDDPATRLAYGTALLESGKPAEALVHLERAVALSPDDTAALRRLGQARALLGQSAEASALFERVLRADPTDWATHANLAGLLADHNPAAALEHAQTAHNLKPDDVRTAINLAEALERVGRPAEAIAAYERIARGLAPDDPFRAVIRSRIDVLRRR